MRSQELRKPLKRFGNNNVKKQESAKLKEFFKWPFLA
jgi:hypothetical protein